MLYMMLLIRGFIELPSMSSECFVDSDGLLAYYFIHSSCSSTVNVMQHCVMNISAISFLCS